VIVAPKCNWLFIGLRRTTRHNLIKIRLQVN